MTEEPPSFCQDGAVRLAPAARPRRPDVPGRSILARSGPPLPPSPAAGAGRGPSEPAEPPRGALPPRLGRGRADARGNAERLLPTGTRRLQAAVPLPVHRPAPRAALHPQSLPVPARRRGVPARRQDGRAPAPQCSAAASLRSASPAGGCGSLAPHRLARSLLRATALGPGREACGGYGQHEHLGAAGRAPAHGTFSSRGPSPRAPAIRSGHPTPRGGGDRAERSRCGCLAQ